MKSKTSSKPNSGSARHTNQNETESIFKSTAKTLGGELKQMGSGAFDTIMGKTPSSIDTKSTTMEQRPSMLSQERMPSFGKRKEKAIDVNIFSFKERQETLYVEQNIKQLVHEIRKEIIAIEKQNKVLIAESRKLTVEQMPEKVGIYHINFLEFILRTLRDIRKKVTEAANWAGVARGKQKRMGYWAMAKKKGTSFTLSGERTPQTQTG